MGDNYFNENNKFLSLFGVLGRRGFIINTLIIELIEGLIWSTPIVYLIMFNPKIIEDFGLYTAKPTIMPLWWTIWIAVVGLISSALYFPSVVRRVRDIIGEVDDNRIYMVASILSVVIFMGYTPVGATFFGKWISFFVILVLIFQKGKITAKKPKSKIIKFNWGAFLGTWIWGLFNKAPITLLMLPLCLTFSWFPFMLICGLMGNEWAAGNDKYDSLEDFHKSQEKQATLWAIIAPILLIVGFVAAMFLSGIVFYNYSKAHPEFKTKFESLSKEYMQVSVESNYTKIELGDIENKFYIEPEIWSKLTPKYRKQMFDMAANYAAMSKNNAEISKSKKMYPINIEVMNKTKIYSSFNNEVLAEYYVNPDVFSKELKKAKTIKEVLSISNSGYKINNYPTLP